MNSSARQFATEIVRTLRARGHQAYLVGGCVRDLLLGREPADYDVATDAAPEQVMQIFPETYAVGAQFGVVLVPIPRKNGGQKSAVGGALESNPHSSEGRVADDPGGEEAAVPVPKHEVIEVATFRCDVGYSDGRHPDHVRYSKSAQEDVQRRDFSINGMLFDPIANEVLDFVGGRQDLEAGIIRTIGAPEERFREDKLRMLRAVRFAARFDYRIEDATLAAIQRLAHEIHQVSRERMRDELLKMLTEGRARRAFELMEQAGLLAEILPEIARMKGVEQPPQFHPEGDVWTHTLLMLEQLPAGASRTLAMGVLLHDVGKPPTFRRAPDRIRFDGHVEVGVKMAEEICRRFRFPNDDTEQIAALVANHMRFADVQRMRQATLKRFLRLPRFEEHLALHRADCLSSHRDLSLYEFTRQKLAQLPPEAIRPTPLLTGNDLIAAGYAPGPRFKEILSAVEDLQLEGKLHNHEEAVGWVRQQFPIESAGNA